MDPVPGVFEGGANVVAVLVLLAEFAMLRAQLLRTQVRLYAWQSLFVAVLAVLVAAEQGIPELYVLAALSVGAEGGDRAVGGAAAAARRRHRHRRQRPVRGGQRGAAGDRRGRLRAVRAQLVCISPRPRCRPPRCAWRGPSSSSPSC